MYYRFNGCYRPITMKKSMVKRRKRVVPVPLEQSPMAIPYSVKSSSALPEAFPAAQIHGQDYHHYYMSSQPMEGYRTTHCKAAAEEITQPFVLAPSSVGLPAHKVGFVAQSPPSSHPELLDLNPEYLGQTPMSQYPKRSTFSVPIHISQRDRQSANETKAQFLPMSTIIGSGSDHFPAITSSTNPSSPGRLIPISSILNHTDTSDDYCPNPSNISVQEKPSHNSISPVVNMPTLPGLGLLGNYQKARLQCETGELRKALKAKEREIADIIAMYPQ